MGGCNWYGQVEQRETNSDEKDDELTPLAVGAIVGAWR
jgi:hypothetical protein